MMTRRICTQSQYQWGHRYQQSKNLKHSSPFLLHKKRPITPVVQCFRQYKQLIQMRLVYDR